MTEEQPDHLYEHLTRLVNGVDDDLILPQQFFVEHCSGDPKEYNLRYKVFRAAIRDFFKFAGSLSRDGRRKYGQAEAWIISRDQHWPYSFERLCEVFHLDPGQTRERLLTKKKAQQEARYHQAVRELHEEAQAEADQAAQPVGDSGPLSDDGRVDEGSPRSEAGSTQPDAGLPQ